MAEIMEYVNNSDLQTHLTKASVLRKVYTLSFWKNFEALSVTFPHFFQELNSHWRKQEESKAGSPIWVFSTVFIILPKIFFISLLKNC